MGWPPLCPVLRSHEAFQRGVCLFNDYHVRVHVNRVHRSLKRCRMASKLLLIGYWSVCVETISQRVDERGESVSDAMDVFAYVHTPWPKVGKHFLKCNHLLLWLVSAVIDQNIQRRHRLPEPFPKRAISLIADVDRRVPVLVHLTTFFDVYAVKLAVCPEIARPHQHATTAVDTDLQDADLTTDELV